MPAKDKDTKNEVSVLPTEETFKPNSHKYRDEKEKKVEKVISGNVVSRKKSPWKRFKELFLADDSDTVKSYVFYDIIVPAIKNTISDVVGSAVEMLLFGETKASKANKPLSYVSYNNYYNNPQRRQPVRDAYSNRRINDFRDIILGSRSEAEQVLNNLVEIAMSYGSATIADLYDLVGITGNFTDNKYGWFDLGDASIRRVREGYLLELPKAVLLD